MANKRVLWLSDFDFIGSGYFYISTPVCSRMVAEGWEIKAIGLGYRGQEHNFPFSIIPCKDLGEAKAMIYNLRQIWQAEVLVTALDLPLQKFVQQEMNQKLGLKQIAITPLENGPLCWEWAIPLTSMSGVFFISELGKQEAQRAGVVQAEHLYVGVDHEAWRPPTKEEREKLRESMGLKDAFVVTTVADNQERKNLWAAMDIIRRARERIPNIKYSLVTREGNSFGWRLREMAVEMGIADCVSIIERGMPSKDLWVLYASSDLFLLTSKAEGLGMPVLESMACGVPVVATETGALPELLSGGRGVLVKGEYVFRDVWGNSSRTMIDREDGCNAVVWVHDHPKEVVEMVALAREYVLTRTWDRAAKQIMDKISEVTNVEEITSK